MGDDFSEHTVLSAGVDFDIGISLGGNYPEGLAFTEFEVLFFKSADQV